MSLKTWLAKRLPWTRGQTRETDILRAAVRTLVLDADQVDASGEYKRHRVYAQLLKRYPTERKRRLAWLIEDVLMELDHDG